MIEFLNRLFGRQTSGATAKERLRLVLMSDHLSLAPEMIDAMKRDLVDVIARYVEVDRDKVDVHFEHQDKALAMLANIPITGVNRSTNGTSHGEVAASHPEPVEGHLEDPKGLDGHPEPERHPEHVEGQPSAVEAMASSNAAKSNGHRPRRKRRKNGGSSGAPAPAT
jgi:cell division topological specificity factor